MIHVSLAETWVSAQSDKDLREQIFRLVFELFWIKEALISDFLPNLEAELEVCAYPSYLNHEIPYLT